MIISLIRIITPLHSGGYSGSNNNFIACEFLATLMVAVNLTASVHLILGRQFKLKFTLQHWANNPHCRTHNTMHHKLLPVLYQLEQPSLGTFYRGNSGEERRGGIPNIPCQVKSNEQQHTHDNNSKANFSIRFEYAFYSICLQYS